MNGNLKTANLFLFFAILFSAIVLITGGINAYNIQEDVLENSVRSQKIRHRVESIRFFDEVLTNSALLAVNTGDTQWEKRYHLYEPKLDSTIHELLRMDLLRADYQALKMTVSANDRLHAIEHQVFELVHLKKLDEASAIMMGSEYARQKAMYSKGLSSFIKQHELDTDQLQTRLDTEAKRSKWFFGLVILLLAIVWLTIERFLRKGRERILKQNQELDLQIQARKESERALLESKKQIERHRSSFRNPLLQVTLVYGNGIYKRTRFFNLPNLKDKLVIPTMMYKALWNSTIPIFIRKMQKL